MASKVSGIIEKIQSNGSSGTLYAIASTAYGYCQTAANQPAKVVDMTGFTLYEGVTIHIKFQYNNTASSPTLNINDTGAKPIVQYGTTAISTGDATSGWYAGAVVSFTYDGTSWVRDQGFNTNSTYSYMRPYETTAKGSYSTQGANPAKTASAGWKFQLSAGKYFMYTHYYDNTAQSALTLNIGGTGAKPIYINGAASSSSNYTLPGGQYLVYYDGTNYYFRTDNKMTGDITGDAATVNGHTVEKNVPSNAVFTDTNKYHKSGSWSGLTYTATAVNSADELKFTIPTGTSGTTVAVGNHNHDSAYAPIVNGGYLPRTGGEMTGTARISWADSGSWGSSDATFPNKRGGLYWSGTSDTIGLFAEETASDNFNLVIDVGDDASPSLILRNKGTAKITLTPGSGVVSATSFSGSGASLTSLNASNISSGTLNADRLATSGATAGSYGPSAAISGSNGTTMNVPYITVDDKGRVTAISNKVYTAVNTWRPLGTGANDAAAGNHNHDTIYSAIHQTAWSWASDGTKPLSKYVTFDANIAAGNAAKAPDAGWYNGFVTSHGNYLASFILNKHRTDKWYVGWEQYPKDGSTAYTEPTWYLLAHSGNVSTGDNSGEIKIAGINVKVKDIGGAAYKAEDYYATKTEVNGLLAAANAMTFKGTLGTGGTVTELPASHNAGDTYRVITAGTWAGKYCEVGTLIICTTDGTAANDAHWTSVETNEDGAVIGTTPTSSTDNAIVRWDGSSGRIIQNSGITIDDNNTISRGGSSINWNQANSRALLRLTSVNGWSPILSLKAHQGWWNVGHYEHDGYYDHLLVTYLADVDVSGVTNAKNHMDYTVRLIPTVYDSNTSTVTERVFVTTAWTSNSAAKGNSTTPVYVDASGVVQTCTAYGNASVNYANSAGSATTAGLADKATAANLATTTNALAYYTNETGTFGNTGSYVTYLNHIAANAGTNKVGAIDGLLIKGTAYGKAENLISGSAGQMSYGDAGPQIRFNSGEQLGAMIFNHYDNSSGMGAAFHFVTNQDNGAAVKANGLVARNRAIIGGDSVNADYNLYVNGTSYLNGATTINGTTKIGTNLQLWSDGEGGNIRFYKNNDSNNCTEIDRQTDALRIYRSTNGGSAASHQWLFLDTGNFKVSNGQIRDKNGLVSFVQNDTVISNTTDWNDLMTPGCYKVQMSAWGDAATYHSPNEAQSGLYSFGLLFVIRGVENDGEKRTLQIYFPHRSDAAHPIYCRMANGSSPTWQTWHRLTRDALQLTGGTLTGALTLTSQSSAFNDKNILFSSGGRIGGNTSGDIGIYGKGAVYIKPNSNTAASADDGVVLDTDGLRPYKNNDYSLGTSTNEWSAVYTPLLAAGSNSLTVRVGTASTTFTVAKFEGDAFLPGTTSARYIGSTTAPWTNVYATTFTGDLNGNSTTATTAKYTKQYYAVNSTDAPLQVRSNNKNVYIWQAGHATSESGGFSNNYALQYYGEGSSPNNYLILKASNSSTVTDAVQIDENGNITIAKTITGTITNSTWTTLLKPINIATTASASTWAIPTGSYQVWGERFSDTRLKYTPSGGSESTVTDTGDWTMWLTSGGTTNTATLNMRIDGTYYGSFSGNLSGNASNATVMGKGTHTAAITANEFSSILSAGTMTIVGNVSNTSMPKTNNANAELIIKTHPTSGSDYYEARLGFSSNGALYYMPVNATTWQRIAYQAALGDYLPLTGGNMTGKIYSSAARKLQWTTSDSDNNADGASWYGLGGFDVEETSGSSTVTRQWICLSNYWGLSFRARDDNHVKINGNIVLNAANYSSYAVAKTAGVTAVTWDTTNKKLTRTINGTSVDVMTAAQMSTALGLGTIASETATNYLKWQTTSSASTALYNFGVYVAQNTAAGTGPNGSNYYNLINVPYRKASGNTKLDWGWQLGNTTSNDNRLYYRTTGDNTAGDWQTIAHTTTSSNNTGSARQPVYMTSTGTITTANYTVAHFGNAGKSNMNDIGRLHASTGMTQLADPGNNNDNPMNGSTKSTGWHLYWDTNYTDDPNGSNAWVAQIVNRVGTSHWWVRSRSGGTITNGTAWASNWRHLVTSAQAGVGGADQPIYVDTNGELQACTSYANASVNYATSAGSASKITNLTTTDMASDTTTWRRVWISYNDNVTGRPAYKDTIAFQTSTNTLKSGKYLVGDHVTLEYNSTDDSLDFIFI